jgi:DNA polymerase III subunit gamma/tau
VLLSQNAHVKALDGAVLTIGMVNAGARDSFTRSGADEILRQALIDELGVDWKVEAIVDAETPPAPKAPRERAPRPTAKARPDDADTASAPAERPDADIAPPAWAVGDETAAETAAEPPPRPSRASDVQAAKAAVRPMQNGGKAAGRDPEAGASDVSDDDSVVDDGSLTDQELLARELGAEVIEDIRHDAG